MKKRFLSVFLSVVLSFSLLGAVPAAAGAAEGDVCRIDATGYSTLGAALTAVMDGQTIVLLADVAYNNQIVSSTRAFTIDLAGHDLSVTSAQFYCLASIGGKQLAITNSGETESRLTITQTIAEADLSPAGGYGAIYTTGTSSRIVIAPNINTAVTTNMVGMDVAAGSSVQVGKGTIRADRVGIDVLGIAASALFVGDVYGLGSGADGVSCRYGGDVQVSGTVYSDGIGVDAQYNGHVSVTHGVLAYDAHGTIGAYAREGAIVQITGNVAAPNKGIFAEGGSISVEGSVIGVGAGSYGAYSKDTISPAMQGTVTVTGSVYGKRYGAYATEGGTVLVYGDAYATAGSASYSSAAVNSRGVGSTIIVTGNATAAGQDSSGIEVYAGGTAEVDGNIEALGASSHGVRAYSGTYYEVLYGSTATVDGTITATKYILIGATEKASDAWSERTLNGYYSFSGAYPTCYVFVKIPALQAAETPAASPAGGAVAAGTTVTLTTATPGAEIRYTLDGSDPSASSELYSEPIIVTAAVTVKAVAIKSGLSDSAVMTASYTILTPPETGADHTIYFVVTAAAGSGGSIAPEGRTAVAEYSSAVYSIAPLPGYLIADVLVDGVSVGKVQEYRFTSVRANHTIEARFAHDCPSKAYTDLDVELWYHDGIDFVLSKGLFVGTSAVLFEPDSPMTRAMSVMILYRLAGSPQPFGSSSFNDVPADAWYAAAVTWGAETAVIEGYGDGRFGPNDPVTREQFTVILYRYAVNAGRNVTADKPSDMLAYCDVSDISDYALTAVKWACGTGLIEGDDGARINPKSGLTRAEAAAQLMRLCRKII